MQLRGEKRDGIHESIFKRNHGQNKKYQQKVNRNCKTKRIRKT